MNRLSHSQSRANTNDAMSGSQFLSGGAKSEFDFLSG